MDVTAPFGAETTGCSAVTSCGGWAGTRRCGLPPGEEVWEQTPGVTLPQPRRGPFWPYKRRNGGLWPGLLPGDSEPPEWEGARAGGKTVGEGKWGKCLFWNQMIKLVPESL